MVEQVSHFYPRLQLFISCRKLKDVEKMSKTDPIVEVFQRISDSTQWIRLGNTQIIWDNLNPDFTTFFTLEYMFEEIKYLHFRVYNGNDKKQGTLKGAQFLAEAECRLDQIITSGQQLIRTLFEPKKKESCGTIILRTEEMQISKQEVTIQLQAHNLKDISGFMRKFKPFFYISRSMQGVGNVRIYMSEAERGKDVTWKAVTFPVQVLCNNDYDRPILFEVYDRHSNGSHKWVGTATSSLRNLTENNIREISLTDGKSNRKKLGSLFFKQLSLRQKPTFIDYIRGGCQISLICAIDFTASNKHPSRMDSLHYMNPDSYNDYEKAIESVGRILLNYDSDKQVPMYGYGGKIGGGVSHCFHMNFNPQNPDVYQVQGMLNAYRNALQHVQLSGPTLFSHVIRTTVLEAQSANVNQRKQQYFILLILTDGQINDMQQTIDWIVRGSFAPMSIIIVGVGNDSFANMDHLDSDDTDLIDSRGKHMARDIVQFVPFNKVQGSATRLASEVLDELPRQIVNWFFKHDIKPNDPVNNFRESQMSFESMPPIQPGYYPNSMASFPHPRGGTLPPGMYPYEYPQTRNQGGPQGYIPDPGYSTFQRRNTYQEEKELPGYSRRATEQLQPGQIPPPRGYQQQSYRAPRG